MKKANEQEIREEIDSDIRKSKEARKKYSEWIENLRKIIPQKWTNDKEKYVFFGFRNLESSLRRINVGHARTIYGGVSIRDWTTRFHLIKKLSLEIKEEDVIPLFSELHYSL